MLIKLKELYVRILIVLILITVGIDAFGQWVKRAESRAFTRTTAQSHDASGNVYAVGLLTCNTIFATDTLFNNSCGEVSTPGLPKTQLDGFLASYDENGNFRWSSQFTGESGNKILINGMETDVAGNSYLGGEFIFDLDLNGSVLVNDDTTSDAFLTKILPDGTLGWALKIGAPDSSLISIHDVTIDNTSVYVSGQFRGRIDVGADNDSVMYKSAFIASYDLNGNPQWLRTLPPVETSSESLGKAITVDNGNLFVLVNFSDSVAITANDTLVPPNSINDAGAILRYQTDGTFLTHKVLNTAELNDVYFNFNALSLYVTGAYLNDFAVGSDTVINDTGTRAFLLSVDENIVSKWLVPIESNNITGLLGNSISVNDVGNVFLSGTFAGSFVTAGALNTTGNSTTNGFLLKTDNLGAVSWLQSVGGSGTDEALTMSALDEDRVYCGGYFEDYIRFGGEEIYNESSASHGFVARVDVCPQLTADINQAIVNYRCDGDLLLLEATQNAAYTYQWYKNGLPIATAMAYNFDASEAGVYQAEVTGGGCTKFTPSRTLSLNPLPDTTLTANKNLLLCAGDSITLSGPTSTFDFQWLESGVAIPAEIGQSFKAKTDGDYSLQVTTDSLCILTSDVREVRFLSYPDSSLNLESRQVICGGDNVLLQAEDDATYKYEWFRDAISIPSATSSSYMVESSGIYNAFLSNPAGCSSLTRTDTVVVQTAPLIDLNDEFIDPVLCTGDSVQIITTSISTQTYQWRRNGVNLPGETDNTVIVKQGGDYDVFVANATCSDFSDIVPLAEVALPVAQILNVSAAEICEGETTILTANDAADITYQWYRNDIPLTAEMGRILSATESGEYFVEVENLSGCKKESDSENIIVNLAPPATISTDGNLTICQGDAAELRGNEGSGLSYQWYNNGVAIAGATGRILNATTSGDYSIEVSNSNQCKTLSSTTQVEVVPIPDATISFDLEDICQGDSLLLAATTDPTYSYSWHFNNFAVAGAMSDTFYAKEAGDYQLVVSVGTCRDSSAVTSLSVIANPKPTITRNADFLSISLFGEIQWFLNGQSIPNANTQNIQVTEDGVYTVSVINAEGCLSTSEPIAMCLPIPEITVVNDVLKANVANQTYTWFFKDNVIEGATKQQLKAQQSGEYSVLITFNDGCSMESFPVSVCIPFPFITQDELSGVLFANPQVAKSYQWFYDSIPLMDETLNVLIPEMAGLYKVEITDFDDCTSTSQGFLIEEITGLREIYPEINIYPNPAADRLTIDLPADLTSNAEMYDLSGKLLLSTEIRNEANQLDLSGIEAGSYLLLLYFDKEIYPVKIYKE